MLKDLLLGSQAVQRPVTFLRKEVLVVQQIQTLGNTGLVVVSQKFSMTSSVILEWLKVTGHSQHKDNGYSN